VIELLKDRTKRRANVAKVLYPAFGFNDWSSHMHLDTKGMSMQARALVRGRQIGQAMCGFDGEQLEDFHDG
jgi:hypothetical protein